jgi:hypothetical protein
MACGPQMVGRVSRRAGADERLGIVRQQNPRGCVRPGRIEGTSPTGRHDLLAQLGWIALALLAAGLLMLAVS